ncbi:hypothetical protein K490DRAFT_36800 [Saccharata proteae CBS 121410]|uniref:Uncharacterized protein n=1 Tax=Saccharata proteae CBS 121410 TaxID=1314787 RepID=A0A6A5YBT3_9PEZI|nr:hypothetical protein K490DRAFT_36800 [Saccharata proteae CBS 121410]
MAVNGTSGGVGQLVEHVALGFDALSSEYRILFEQHRELENKLSWAKQQYLDIVRRFTPDVASEDYTTFSQGLEEAERHGQTGPADWLDALAESRDGDRRTAAYIVRQAELARDKLKSQLSSKESDGVKIWNGPSADKADRQSDRVMKLQTLAQQARSASLENDFTVPGTPSRLGCPFAASSGRGRSMSGRRSLGTPRSSHSRILPHAMRSKRSSFNDPINDPIKAETCGIDGQSPEPSVAGSQQPVCPIRFLDQHSPEEIAKYFENHKHEIPRSHEVCVKRFQTNSESIRQLDAKYGSLVNMIQGLGVKHKPMLPDQPDDEEEAIEADSTGRVANWAKAVSTNAENGQEDDDVGDPTQILDADEADRLPRFDRPLKEIRVGESPSRPWGISVPAKYNKPRSEAASAKSEPTASPALEAPPEKKPSKCPFDHTKMMGMMGGPPHKPTTEPRPEPSAPDLDPAPTTAPGPASTQPAPPQEEQSARPNIIPTSQKNHEATQGAAKMVFTGPVFIGYSVEQATALLQGLGWTGKP